jgi:tetratricopeptide (TPR) repeat protein
MEFLTLSAIGLGLSAVSETLAGGIAGNAAYDLCKGGVRSLAERAQAGELRPNHLLLRAARRAQLRATRFTAAQFSKTLTAQPADRVRHLLAWCGRLEAWLGEEIEATQRDDYRIAMPPLDAAQAALLMQPAEAGDLQAQRDAFAAQVLDALVAELGAWNDAENQRAPLLPAVPEGFTAMLAEGWVLTQHDGGQLRRVFIEPLTRRRGAGAQMVRRGQQRQAEAEPAVATISWFECFASEFSVELSRDTAVQAVFNAKLLADLVLTRRQAGLPEGDPGAELAELLRAQGEALGGKLDAIAEDVHIIKTLVQPAWRAPWQLPPRAIEASFQGRAAQLEWLVARLRRAEPCTYVLGPAGFGKTALAAEALHRVVGEGGQAVGNPFRDGVVYLDLYALKARPDAVWSALATALGEPGDGQTPPEVLARRACAGRRLLLVLEGAEVADGAGDAARLAELLEVLDPTSNRRLVLTRDSAQCLPVQTCRVDEPLAPGEAEALFDQLAVPAPPAPVRQQVLDLLQGHPLALTWAASLLADPAEDAAELAADWRHAALPPLSDPHDPERTLRWLFARSMRGLDADSTRVLVALGHLAHAGVALAPVVSVLSASEAAGAPEAAAAQARALAALKRLTQRSLLRRLPAGGDGWQFAHVLAYQFARAQPVAEAEGQIGPALQSWAVQALNHAFSAAGWNETGPGRADRLIRHADALLEKLGCQDGYELFVQLQYRAFDRAVSVGQLGLALACGEASTRALHLARLEPALPPQWVDREFSVALNRRGGVVQAQGRLEEALVACKESLAVGRRLAAADPSNTQWQRDVSVSLENMGRIRRAQGRLDEALVAYEESLAVARRLAAADPSNTQSQRDVSVSLDNVGRIRQSQGRLDEALVAYEQSLAVARRLAAADPSDTQSQRDVSVSLDNVGHIRQAQGRLDEALVAYEESLAVARRLAAADPSNTQWQRDVSVSLDNVGRIRRAQGRLGEALVAYEESLALRRRLAAADPSNALWQRDVGVSLDNVGRIRQAQGRLDEALVTYEESLAVARRLAAADPSNTEWQRDVSVSLDNVGRIRQAQGRLDEALVAFEESLALRRGLAAADPSNTEWQRDVSVSLDNVGHIRQAQGRLDEALVAHEESLAVARRLTAADPSNTDWQHGLSYSLTIIAEVLAQQGRRDEGCELARESLAIDERLAALAPDHATWQADVRVSRALVTRLCGPPDAAAEAP